MSTVLIDGHHMMHRCAFIQELQRLKTHSGVPVGPVFGFLRVLGATLKRFKATSCIVVWDTGRSTYRKELYPEYKANRVRQETISAQELIIRKMIELLGMASVVLPGYEADDLIGCAVKQYSDKFDIDIITGDKDLLQLIGNGVHVYDTMKNVYYGEEEVMKKFGVRPDQIVDFLAIAGDKVDNIPGVRGLGKVGVGKLLAEYNSLEEIYENIDKIVGKTQEKLIKSKDDAFMSYELASLITNVEMPDPSSLGFNPQTSTDLIELFTRLEFNSGLLKLNNLWTLYK